MISVVVLKNGMELLKGELGSSSEICVTSTVDGNKVTGMEAERVCDMKDEEVELLLPAPDQYHMNPGYLDEIC